MGFDERGIGDGGSTPDRGYAPGGESVMNKCAGCAVRGVCLPAGMPERDLHGMDGVLVGRRRVHKGQVLFREGDRFLFVYAVRYGSFKSSVMLKDGSDQVASVYLRGELMGLDAAADGHHATTVTALEDSEICAIPYLQLTEAASSLRSLRLRLVQLAGAELVRDRRLLALVANTHVEARVAAFLLQLAQRMQERGYRAGDSLPNLSRTDMGSHLGTTQETVSRCLTSFARRGLISLRKRRIRLGDADRLKNSFEAEFPS